MSKELKLIEALIDALGYDIKEKCVESCFYTVDNDLLKSGSYTIKNHLTDERIKVITTNTNTEYKLIKKELGNNKMIGWSCVNNNPPPQDEDIVLVDDGDIYWRATSIAEGSFTCAQGHMLTPSHWMSIIDATKMLGIINNE